MTETHDSGIVVDGVTKRYRGRAVVDDLSLRIPMGETLGVLGANGAGKTTTVEMIAGLRRPDAGSIRVLGVDPVGERAKLRQVLGVQLQEAELHDALTVSELVRLHRSFHADPVDGDDLLTMVGLTDQAKTRFSQLSGGQQQRLSVAIALVGRPRAVLLDELTTGLDPRARRTMWATVERLQGEGATIVLVSHAMEELERLCHRVVVLDRGRSVAQGTVAEVVRAAGADGLEEAFLALTGQTADDLAELDARGAAA